MGKNKLNIAINISALMLAIGTFLPLVSIPIYGVVTYYRIAEIESYLLILFALSAPALLIIGKHKLVKLAPIGAWLVLLFPTLKNLFKSEDKGFFGEIGDKASSVMQEFAGDLFLNITEFSWGGFVFLIGLVAFTVSCLMHRSR